MLALAVVGVVHCMCKNKLTTYAGVQHLMIAKNNGLPEPSYTVLMDRVGQNHRYAPYMTVYLVISLPKYRIYTVYIYGSGQP